MHDYTLVHLSDAALLRDLVALVARDRLTTATLLAHIAEVDARRLYVPAGYPSMHAYCVEELRLSEDAAYKRIQAARAAREFPALFPALAEGKLHLAAVCLLAPHLTPENVEDLIRAATHRRKSEIEEFLARCVPPAEGPARVSAVLPCPIPQLAPGQVEDVHPGDGSLAPGQVEEPRSELASASPERFLLQLTIPKDTRDKLSYAQALLSHAVPGGDVAQVLDRALDALIVQLEKRKFGAPSPRPRSARVRPNCGSLAPGQVEGGLSSRQPRTRARRRSLPADVRRAVWDRDQGRCTFVGARGNRCRARRLLEFDHILPVARGGEATVEGLRLRCRAHNQYEAERTFGTGFMTRKRHEARLIRAQGQARAWGEERARQEMAREAPAREERAREAPARQERAQSEVAQDVIAVLRGLGCRAEEARRAAEFAVTIECATLEERMRAALKFIGRRSLQVSTR